ncbi:MAG: hypothetical protein FWE03_01765 [Firmicutes bacterium]|nr:hypothetical protein [Bacillota bacterium]
MKIKKLLSISLVIALAIVLQGCFFVSCFEDESSNGGNTQYIFYPPHALRLRYTGQLFQEINNTSPVTFTATTNLGSRPDLNFRWYINNQRQISSSTNSFTLSSQSQTGEFVIRAVAQNYPNIQAVKTVRVYNNFQMPLLINNGSQTYDSIDYTAAFSLVDHGINTFFVQNNPPLYIEWLINNQVFKSGIAINSNSELLDFYFNPDRAGKFYISARVNGISVFYDREIDYIEIIFRGSIQIDNLAVCLNRYPQIQITWDNRENTMFSVQLLNDISSLAFYQVWVNANDGGVIVYSSSVDGGSFNILQNIYILVENLAGETYECIFIDGGFASYEFAAISNSALSFVRSTYLLGNYFMQSDQDIYDILNYMIVFRPNQTRQTASAGAIYHFNAVQTYVSRVIVYIGHNSIYSPNTLTSTIGNHINFTGRYFFSITSTTGNTNRLTIGSRLTISIEFVDQLEPNMHGIYVSSQGKVTANPFRAPQFSQTGWQGCSLPIDYYPIANSVARTSDQLFFAVTNGFNPIFDSNSAASAAERIYNIAYNALKKIVDENMTKAQKAAAIYDYVMFLSSYDYAMLDPNMCTGTAVRHPAFYMEGVFETGFAVCDGMAKAFGLMAKMVGIETIRIIGPARFGLESEFGQHAWNKINLYGEWFIVDTTWGIPSFSLGTINFKLMSQGWFLLNDFDVSGGRIEQGINNPLSSYHNFNWFYQNGRFIHDSDCLNEQLNRVVDMIVGGAEEWARAGGAFYTAYTGYLTIQYFVLEFDNSSAINECISI